MRRVIVGSIFFGLILISLLPAILNTVKFVSDARGLVTIATLSSKDVNLNPYSKDAMLINPNGAVWILKSFDYPYHKCSEFSEDFGDCSVPLISWVGRTFDHADQDSQLRGYSIMDLFIERGEPLNAKSQGLTSMHEAILLNNAKYLNKLLNAGADPLIKSDDNGKSYANLNAFEYLAYLNSKQPNRRIEIDMVLNSSKKDSH